MDGARTPLRNGGHSSSRTLCNAQVSVTEKEPVRALQQQLGPGAFSLVCLFVSHEAEFPSVVAEADRLFPDTDVIACTTAGEIGQAGYDDGQIVAIAFPSEHFASRCLLIDDLDDIATQDVINKVVQDRVSLAHAEPDLDNSFAFLLVDGLCLKEDELTAALSPALGEMPLFGGSAGDGTAFENTWVALNGQIRADAAVLSLVRTDCRTHVFSLDHLVPSERRMVVTEADPAQRIVKKINAEPAAREYARIVGKDPDQLDRFTFAAHPVVARIGGSHHVRAIQRVNEAGELVFFSAIDEGMVLTVADPLELAGHLDDELGRLAEHGNPAAIIGCDCLLRRIEADQTQASRAVSDVLSRHNVLGFSTYGEQIGPLHVNHTMTGVAIYPHVDEDPDVADKPVRLD